MREGMEIARLSHDPSTLADPDIRAAVVKAVDELKAHNMRLRTDLEAQARRHRVVTPSASGRCIAPSARLWVVRSRSR